ncbi:sulfite exporter TauE/SafE family protein [Simiduia agarivorans]|uniref:Probable membrane transporter protein n=1 Tax=Simiduia agarivorans (strain DSM 21679 / JCM 13881 / BCRC 17597 / SA1) TaxID=1117647 RepID=K4KK86_SIMAS|nr:sulfite exporter TauE/SafE family protein [Simiduia agarivorans]AFU98443.1 hypothetical protein M5M_06240 [Simiduia agarivorans SA1 = DSM 21679]
MNWTLIGLFILISYTLEAITGFGSIVIALSLGALILPMDQLLPVLVPLNIFMSGFLVVKHRQHILWPLLLKIIAPLMVLGTIAGAWLRPALAGGLLAVLFAVVIAVFGARELYRSFGANPVQAHPRWLNQLLMAGAGLTHGLFASGGPLLVFALAGTHANKSQMRATLLAVWFSLNCLLTLLFLLDGQLLPVLPKILMFLPLLLVGVWLGEKLHHALSDLAFRRLIYSILLTTGLLLLLRALL